MQEAAPILVWTMGKVGTTTVSRALACAGIPALHMHSIRPKPQAAAEAQKGLTPPHVKAARKALGFIRSGAGTVKIISMVRDPVARNISAFFENMHLHGISHELPTEELIGVFQQTYNHDIPLRWFDLELKAGIGFDIFREGFDHTSRLSRYAKDRFELLIFRSDAGLDLQQREVSDFVGAPVELTRENAADSKPYRAAYKDFNRALSLPKAYVERMYSSEFARLFWTREELEEMSLKYLGEISVE